MMLVPLLNNYEPMNTNGGFPPQPSYDRLLSNFAALWSDTSAVVNESLTFAKDVRLFRLGGCGHSTRPAARTAWKWAADQRQ
jgi:hypothetical protein